MENMQNPENTNRSAEDLKNAENAQDNNIQETNELPEKVIGNEPPADAEMAPTAQPENEINTEGAETETEVEPVSDEKTGDAPEISTEEKPADITNNVSETAQENKDVEAAPENNSSNENEITAEVTEGGLQAEEAPYQKFSPEEKAKTQAKIPGNNSDEHLDEAHEEEHADDAHADDHADEEIDFSTLGKDELLRFIISATEKQDERNINKKVQTARGEFNRIIKEEREQALADHKAENADEEGFADPNQPLIEEFNAAFKNFKKRRHEYINNVNKQKDDNLQHKKTLLEKLKHLSEGEESGSSFNEFKKLQEEWRSIGHVPIAEAENIWNTYNYYVDRFYEQRSLYSEFKELDRKRNFTAKEELVKRITALNEAEDMNEALKQLRVLQDEWRHLGPVPRENADDINQRYKDAVIQLYEKREKLSEELQKRREQNYDAKVALLGKIEEIAAFEGERVQDWMAKNQELGQWIENWRSIGAVPTAKSQEMRERFTAAIRKFNHEKNEFFRSKKKEKVDNLRKKTELAEKVENILEAENASQRRKEVIKLQDDWKKVGPVPSKYSDKIWKRFQAACDAFFAKISSQQNEQQKEQTENLQKKYDLIKRVEALAAEEKLENPKETIRSLQTEFNEIGFVPFKEKDKVRKQFFDAINALISKVRGGMAGEGSASAQNMSYELMLQSWAQEPGGNQRLNDEERKHQRDLKKIENEIATLENNMEFFRNSKTADALKQNLEKQISQLRGRLDEVKDKIKLVRSAGK